MPSISRLFFIICAVFLISTASAEARVTKVFKCYGQRVEGGDSTYSVLKKCGTPAYKETLSSAGCDKVEKWHYDCKGRGNVEELIFKKGTLVERIRGENSPGTQDCQ